MYISEGSYLLYYQVLFVGNTYVLPTVSFIFLLTLSFCLCCCDLFLQFKKRSHLLKDKKDFCGYEPLIKVLCLMYVVLVLFLRFFFILWSDVVRDVPETDLDNCRDTFSLIHNNTSHKTLNQMAIDQGLHCVEFRILDALESFTIALTLSVAVIALNVMFLCRCLRVKEDVKFCSPSSVCKSSVFVVYMLIGVMVPLILYQYIYSPSLDFRDDIFVFAIFHSFTLSFLVFAIIY